MVDWKRFLCWQQMETGEETQMMMVLLVEFGPVELEVKESLLESEEGDQLEVKFPEVTQQKVYQLGKLWEYSQQVTESRY